MDFGGKVSYANMADGWAKINKFNVDATGVGLPQSVIVMKSGTVVEQVPGHPDIQGVHGGRGAAAPDDHGACGTILRQYYCFLI